MKQLKLDLDELAVESFVAGAGQAAKRGTVEARSPGGKALPTEGVFCSAATHNPCCASTGC